MRALIPVLIAAILPGLAAAQAPRPTLEQLAERHLMPCPDPNSPVCEPTRKLFLMVWPLAWQGDTARMRRVAELLAEGDTPPMRRDQVEACGWATVAWALAANRAPDGVTAPQAERDALMRQCLRHGERVAAPGRRRSEQLLAEMTERARRR